jgi:hypothetical protein
MPGRNFSIFMVSNILHIKNVASSRQASGFRDGLAITIALIGLLPGDQFFTGS